MALDRSPELYDRDCSFSSTRNVVYSLCVFLKSFSFAEFALISHFHMQRVKQTAEFEREPKSALKHK